MNHILALLKSFFAGAQPSADESYLARAVDLADLERRMRTLENGQLDPSRNPIVSFG